MKIFSVEGNIGSGKSTLIEYLKQSNKYIYLPEPVSIWNEIKDLSGVTILENYYKDQKKYSFPFQMMAYISRLSTIKNAVKSAAPDNIIFTERCIYTDREIFARMLYDSNLIEEIEYSIYLKWFDEFSEIKLDGIIYIESTPETCAKRVNNRNRKGEESIPLDYLIKCNKYHENWINSTNVPVLVIDGEPEQSNKIIEQIDKFVKINLKK